MHACITTLTLFATLFHFAVGCCGHLHIDCGHGADHSEPTGTCYHRSHRDRELASDAAAKPAPAHDLAMGVHHGGPECPGHDCCHGCSCSATPLDRPLETHRPELLSVAWDTPTITFVQSAVSVAWEAADPPVRADIAPPLSERLLV